jgi:hypothetical protein
VVMSGTMYHCEYLDRLRRHLVYRWMGAYLVPGAVAKAWGGAYGQAWKPLLHFDRGGERRFVPYDVFRSDRPDKAVAGEVHGWGQSESGMADIIERLTKPGELVVDPFLGAGTTAVVCHDLGRRFVGCDIDADAVAASRERLGG